jgi:threonine synthase
MAVEALRCRVCEAEYPAVASGTCLRCFGPLEPVYDWDAIGRKATRPTRPPAARAGRRSSGRRGSHGLSASASSS